MSEIDLSASAWISEGRLGFSRTDDSSMESRWKLRAEVSVSDVAGKPLASLAKNAWSVHVTDYNGWTLAPSFTVAKANVSGQALPGFYIVAIDDLRLPGYFVAPTALGLTVERKGSRGQLVVPVAISGYRVVQLHAPWMP